MKVRASPLVSVVVPCFNHQTLVKEALRSVLEQDYANLELLVLDDASKDATAEVVQNELAKKAYGKRFESRARLVVHPKNLGAHCTINEGLASAQGAYLTVLNSDDVYAPGRISRLVKAMEGQGSQLGFSSVAFIDHAGLDVSRCDSVALSLQRAQENIAAFPSVGFAALKQNVAISTGNMVISRTLYQRLGGFAPLAYCHDWDFLLRALLLTEPAWVPEPLYRYRLHSDNSFRSLGHLADQETRRVLQHYLAEVWVGAEENPLAPSPRNWPGVFEYWLERLHLRRFWKSRS